MSKHLTAIETMAAHRRHALTSAKMCDTHATELAAQAKQWRDKAEAERKVAEDFATVLQKLGVDPDSVEVPVAA